MFDQLKRMETARLVALVGQTQRDEARAAARRAAAIAVLVDRLSDADDPRERWALDPWDALAAELSAVQGISSARASSQMYRAQALNRLPAVAALFAEGLIEQRLVDVVIGRTELIADREALALVDKEIAESLRAWGRLPQRRLIECVDTAVQRHDPDGRRRTRSAEENRHIGTNAMADGLTALWGTVHTEAAEAFTAKLDQLAATVCTSDPRTLDQRRADAVGPLSLGHATLPYRCGDHSCPADRRPVDVPVLVHVIATQSTLDGHDDEPGYLRGAGVIGAEQLRRLAEGAARRAIRPPAGPEPQYRPSRTLADYVRARDLGCRFPGCAVPADRCDIDHTIPHAAGGSTAAENLKLLCRKHHLLKTFYDWRDAQRPDGTVVWTSPEGESYVTTPAGAGLFPALAEPLCCLAMPIRKRTRRQERNQRITAERRRNYEPPPF